MTTAQLRTAAYEAEKALNWLEAARLWDEAADNHPAHRLPKMGAMDAMDIAKMRQKAENHRHFASLGA